VSKDAINKRIVILNTATGSILSIPEKTYKLLKEGKFRAINSITRIKLANSDILVPSNKDETEDAVCRILHRRSHKDLRVVLIPTYSCNLQCPYCYEAIPESHIGSRNARWSNQITDFICHHMEKENIKNCCIALFGGEPLLEASECLKIIRDISSSIEQTGKTLYCTLTTNGTILSKDVYALLNHMNYIQVTLDGVGDRHNQIRQWPDGKGTFEQILEFVRVADQKGVARIGIRLHLHKYSDSYLRKCSDILWQHIGDLHSVYLYFAEVTYGCYDYVIQCRREKGKTLEGFQRLRQAREIFLSQGWPENRVYTHSEGNQETGLSANCGMIGTESYIIDGNNDIYFCPVALGDPKMRLGYLKNGCAIFTSLRERLITSWKPHESCLDCEILPLCEGGCVAKAAINNGSPLKPYCEKRRIIESLRRYSLEKGIET